MELTDGFVVVSRSLEQAKSQTGPAARWLDDAVTVVLRLRTEARPLPTLRFRPGERWQQGRGVHSSTPQQARSGVMGDSVPRQGELGLRGHATVVSPLRRGGEKGEVEKTERSVAADREDSEGAWCSVFYRRPTRVR